MKELDYIGAVTGDNSEVIGDPEWEAIMDKISNDVESECLASDDVFVCWKMGLAAYQDARKLGATFPHD